MITVPINRIVEDFNRLTLNDKEYAVDIFQKQLIDAKRDAISKRAKEAMSSLKKGTAKRGTMADLRRDLESD